MKKASALRQRIEEIITALSETERPFSATDVLSKVGETVSRQYIASILKSLVAHGNLTRQGDGRGSRYKGTKTLTDSPAWNARISLAGQSDYRILEQFYQQTPQALSLSEDVRSIFAYAFTEMVNNAIDHSESAEAEMLVFLTPSAIRFVVRDFGVGVFRNIKTKYNLVNEIEAIQELLKGKTTTAPQAHSGEGIFFTSKIADLFVLNSYDYRLRIDNRLPDIFVEKLDTPITGTEVVFQLSTSSTKHLNDIFKQYQSPTDLAFDKTRAYIKLFTTGTIYVSRSQAKRVLSGIPERNFNEIILDFSQVPTIGQAFADETFRVFATAHPNIKLTPVNANEAVTFMINRVQSPQAT
jgi:anti-sigma regulatory factor (Ser/Thr protein kinase)